MSKIFFYASYSMSFCQGVIYINAPKILMANEAPTQKSTNIFLPHVVKTQTDTLGSASRFIKTYALQKHPTLASALSQQTVRSCSRSIHLPLFAHPSALKTTTQIQPIPSHQHPLTCCGRQEMIWTESLRWLFWTRAHRSLGRCRGAKIPHGAARSCWGVRGASAGSARDAALITACATFWEGGSPPKQTKSTLEKWDANVHKD